MLVACGTVPPEQYRHPRIAQAKANLFKHERDASPSGQEVTIFALTLLNTGYVFGGAKNPEAGLDCSGFVTYVYAHAVNITLKGNAASLAQQGKHVSVDNLRSGDLVFFNTLGHSFSHVGIYIGNGNFIHAPNSRGKIRIDEMSNRYWSYRFETGRTLLN